MRFFTRSQKQHKARTPCIGLSVPKLNEFILGNGETYNGSANKGESGTECQIWKDSPYLSFVLDQDKIANLGDALNGNYCRNPDGDAGYGITGFGAFKWGIQN